MLRRRIPDLPYLRLKDWADSGEVLTARCASCEAEQPLRPATLVARHGWHGVFAKAVAGLSCPACGGSLSVVRPSQAGISITPIFPHSAG